VSIAPNTFDRHADGVMMFASVRDAGARIADFRWLYMNGAAARIVGRADLVGKRLLEEMPGNRDAGLFDAYAGVVESGEPLQRELHYGGEGMDHWFRISALRHTDGLLVFFADLTEAKRAETQLREREAALFASESTLRAFYDNAPLLMGVVELLDEDVLHVYDNRSACAFFGVAPDGTRGVRASTLGVAKETVATWLSHSRQAERSGAALRFEHAFDSPAGPQTLAVVVSVIGKAASGRTRLCYVAENVTDARLAEDALRASRAEQTRAEQRLRLMTENAPTYLVHCDGEGRFLFANKPYAERFGRSPADIVGKTIAEVVGAAAYASFRHHVESITRTGQAVEWEAPVRYADGVRVMHCRYVVDPASQSPPFGFIAVLEDVTERHREGKRRELLAKASQVFAASLDLGPMLTGIAALFVPEAADWATLYLRNDDGSLELAAVTHVDRAQEAQLRALFDSTSDEVRATWWHVQPLQPGDYHLVEDVDDAFLRRMAGGDGATAARARELSPVSTVSVPMMVHGRVLGTLTLASCTPTRRFHVDDVPLLQEIAGRAAEAIENARLFEMARSERRRADDANRAKDEFLAVVSHELRTPLNAILGWSKMLSEGTLDAAGARKATETIERNAKVQAKLIEDLLDIARIITGKIRLELDAYEPLRLVEAAVDVVAPAAEAKGVRIACTLAPDVPSMMGDPSRLQQAVWNLLSNAVKFTPHGGDVGVVLAHAGGAWTLTVTDSGAGIAPEFLPHVFERFRQADMGSRRRHTGLGLGLSIVRHIAELHGGTVHAASAGLGAGSSFRLVIPGSPVARGRASAAVQVRTPPPGAAAPAPAMPQDLSRLSVLVLDDEPDARELLASMLGFRGARVRVASSVKEALAAIATERPDVLVSDIGMPLQDGYDLIERLRALPAAEGGALPAVALTAYARTADRTRALLAGFNAHLTKPVEIDQLAAVIASIVPGAGRR
jgi:PAS domain S-box-containing protein